MKKIAPLQIGNLGKAFFIVLLVLTLAWSAISWLFFRDIYAARPILIANLILSVILGWFYYRYRYHVTFSYNGEGFQLRYGVSPEIRRQWKDFDRVSLVHVGAGQMVLRLYRRQKAEAEDEDIIEIPASALGLEAFALRDEIAGYIHGAG